MIAVKISLRTICDLRRYFNPKSLGVCVVKVDDFEKEDNNSSAPEH